MGAKHPNMCPAVYVTVEGIIDDLLQQLEEQVPNLSERRKMKIRRYVCHRVRSCLPGEFVEPCSAYFSTSELNEEHVSMMRSLVYYTFLRAIRNYWTMRPRSRNSSASRSTLSSDGSLRRTTNQRENQSDSEGEYLAADQTRRESDSTDVKGPRLSSYTVASLVSSNQSGKLPCCSICLADFEENDEIITLPCFHVYHQACVQPWLSSNGGCAVCRLAPMKLVRNMVELLDQFGIGKLTNASPTQLRKDLLKS